MVGDMGVSNGVYGHDNGHIRNTGVFRSANIGGGGNLGHSILFLVLVWLFHGCFLPVHNHFSRCLHIFFCFWRGWGGFFVSFRSLDFFCNIGRGEGLGVGRERGFFSFSFARHYIPDTSLDSTPQLGTFSLLRMRASSSLEHSVFWCSIYSSYRARAKFRVHGQAFFGKSMWRRSKDGDGVKDEPLCGTMLNKYSGRAGKATLGYNIPVSEARVPYARNKPARQVSSSHEMWGRLREADGAGGLGPRGDLPILSKTGTWLIRQWPVKDVVV